MMMRSVYLKTLYDKLWFTIGWTFGFAAFAALMTSFYPAMHQDGVIDGLVENMPKIFEGLIGSLANLKDFPLYIASQLFDIRLPIIAGVMAIILGLGLSTHEEETGELRTLLSLPISRTKILFEKWLALCTIMFIAILGLVIGIYGVLPFIEDASIGVTVLLQLLVLTWLLMVGFGTIAFSAGIAFGSRGIASAISIVVIIGSFILTTFGGVVDWLEKMEVVSLLHYFPAVDTVKNGINFINMGVLIAVTLASLLVAVICFRQRDVQ